MKLDFTDELRIEGINFKGYGIIPKFVMLDTDLTIEAKGIYAYFCSYAGSGNTAFPGWEKIVSDLCINKDSYYKHYKLLIENGYITVTQDAKGGRGQGFAKNIYTIVSNPKKFYEDPKDNSNNKAYAIIKASGLKAAGYGCIAKSVMNDKRLSIKAKALYAYLCSFSGAGDSACPARDIIIHHLQISHNSYAKYIKELVSLNYVEVIQRKVNGKMSVNDYHIVDKPDENNAALTKQFNNINSPCTKISETQISENIEVPCTNFSETQIWDTQKPETQIQEAIINNQTNNKNNKQQSINQQQPLAADETDLTEEEFYNFVYLEMKMQKTLPKSYLNSRKKLETAVKILCDFKRLGDKEKYKEFKDGNFEYTTYQLFVEALTDMLKAQNGTNLLGEKISSDEVYSKLVKYIEVLPSGMLDISDVRSNACEDYKTAVKQKEIKNYLAYMKSCIWNALKIGNAKIEAEIKLYEG